MKTSDKDLAIQKIVRMPETSVSKVLIFMAGMEAEHSIGKKNETDQPHKPPRQPV